MRWGGWGCDARYARGWMGCDARYARGCICTVRGHSATTMAQRRTLRLWLKLAQACVEATTRRVSFRRGPASWDRRRDHLILDPAVLGHAGRTQKSYWQPFICVQRPGIQPRCPQSPANSRLGKYPWVGVLLLAELTPVWRSSRRTGDSRDQGVTRPLLGGQ